MSVISLTHFRLPQSGAPVKWGEMVGTAGETVESQSQEQNQDGSLRYWMQGLTRKLLLVRHFSITCHHEEYNNISM